MLLGAIFRLLMIHYILLNLIPVLVFTPVDCLRQLVIHYIALKWEEYILGLLNFCILRVILYKDAVTSVNNTAMHAVSIDGNT